MQTSEQAQAKRLLQWDQDRYVTGRNLLLNNGDRHETTLVYRCRANSERTDYRQYSVFMTNGDPSLLRGYSYRWEIESGTTRASTLHGCHHVEKLCAAVFLLRACLFAVLNLACFDLLVQFEVTGEYEQSPIVTANTVLTLLKRTGIR
jgi:hypothetical protein